MKVEEAGCPKSAPGLSATNLGTTPNQTHRPRLTHQRAGSQSAPPSVRADAQDVQRYGQAELRPPHGGVEDAGDV